MKAQELRIGNWIIIKSKNKFYQIEFVQLRHDLKYVHQLQNLYFALTGEELLIK